MHTDWQKQGDTPLFPDLVWARPETRAQAGKLLIVGGTGQSFAAAAEAFAAATAAGAGSIRVLLPDSLRLTVAKLFPEADFVPSTPSGSFGLQSLAEVLDAARWADGSMVAADTGNNSETTRLFEAFLSYQRTDPAAQTGATGRAAEAFPVRLTLCGDLVDGFIARPTLLLDRPDTVLVLTFSQLQKLATSSHFSSAFTSDMGLARFVPMLQAFSLLHPAHLVVLFDQSIAVAVAGRVSTTHAAEQSITQVAASAATWWLQNPDKPYEALTTSILR